VSGPPRKALLRLGGRRVDQGRSGKRNGSQQNFPHQNNTPTRRSELIANQHDTQQLRQQEQF
jgi:hypothetical protein